jgi:hypothetical protein
MSAVIYSEFSREIIISVDPQTIPKISLTPTPFSDDIMYPPVRIRVKLLKEHIKRNYCTLSSN